MKSCLSKGPPISVSWTCLPDHRQVPRQHWQTANSSEIRPSDLIPPCVYMFDQTFNQPLQCAPIEAALIFVLFFAGVTTNFVALHRFYRQRIRPEFLLLIFAITLSNCATIAMTMIGGLAKLYPDWYLSVDAGCALVIGSRFALITITNWLFTLVSFERCRTINRQCRLAAMTSTAPVDSQPGLCWCKLASLVALLFVLNGLIWSYPFLYLGIARTFQVFIGGRPTLICGLLAIPSQLHNVVFKYVVVMLSSFIPILFNSICYIKVWVFVRAYRFSRRFDVSVRNRCFDANRQSRLAFEREVQVAKLMATSIALFVLLNIPVYVVMFFTLMMQFDEPHLKTYVPPILLSAAHWLSMVGPVVNPFAQSLFASVKRAHRQMKRTKPIAMTEQPNGNSENNNASRSGSCSTKKNLRFQLSHVSQTAV